MSMNIIRNDWWVTPVWEIQTDFDEKFNDNLLSELKYFYTDEKIKNIKDSNIWVMNTPYVKSLNDYIIKW